MKRILLLDNYDSFTFNIAHMLRELGGEMPDVIKNDRIELNDISKYERIVLSPGPGIPEESGRMPQVVALVKEQKIPLLGVCLGHQCIGESYGGVLQNLPSVFHGQKTSVFRKGESRLLGKQIPEQFLVGRYHSWVVKPDTLPDTIAITAVDKDGAIMAFEHKSDPVFGVQFHPESVMTEHGAHLIKNFLSI